MLVILEKLGRQTRLAPSSAVHVEHTGTKILKNNED